ncbi:MAG: alpha/beta fold hydrolase [Bacteroidia bacterium]|nr:alpha/beta fold hydrolase [Bacteroidia bacterium]
MIIALLIISGLYFIPPKEEVPAYAFPEEKTEDYLTNKVGWYETAERKAYQITWGAKQGLQLNYFDTLRSNLKSIPLTPIDENTYDTNGNLEDAEAVFSLTDTDSVITLQLNTSKTSFTATKKDSLYYLQKEIEYYNGDIKLSGLLLLPFQSNPSVAIVFIHGSGVSDRDNFWYMYQADYLAKKGFVVLLPDKRGCGKSMGEWHTASFNDFANDTKAAVDYLKNDTILSPKNIGVLGLSQGSWISHLVNNDGNDLSFIVDVVGSTTTPNEQLKFELKNDLKSSGTPGFIAKPLSGLIGKRVKGKRKIWWEKNGEFDPKPFMAKTSIPILKILAAEDKNVPSSICLKELDQLITENPEIPITVKTFANTGHALMNEETGWVLTAYLDYVVKWVSSNSN